MAKIAFPIVGTFNKVKQFGINPEQTNNMYLINERDPKVPDALINCPGFSSKFAFPSGAKGRPGSSFRYQKVFYTVCSQFLYQVTDNLQPIVIGQLNTDNGWVSMAGNNNNQLMIVDGANGYIYNTSTNVFSTITDPNFLPNPTSVTFLDGRFVRNSFGTNEYQLSAENDGTTWIDPNNTPLIAALQSQADTIQAVAVNQRMLYLFGKFVTEVWIDIGQAGFPFVRLNTMIFQFGAAALGSVIQGVDMLFFLATSSQGTVSVMLSQGGQARAVSTTDVDQQINNYETVDDADAYIFRENGYMFYAISFTKAQESWLYNITNDSWSQQSLPNGSRHPLNSHVSFNDLNYCTSYLDNNMYELSQNFFMQGDVNMVKERITHRFLLPTVQDLKISYVEVDCLHGFAQPFGTSATPFIELAVSKDAGITFGKNQRAPIGLIGIRNRKTYWHNLGINRDFVFRFRNYDAMPFYLRDMSIWADQVGV